MLRPKLPAPVHVITTAGQPAAAPACTCYHGIAPAAYAPPTVVHAPHPAPRRPVAPYVAAGAAAVAGVVALATVLTALLLAVAVTAVSVAVAAVVLRSLVGGPGSPRR
ncbi:SpdD protein [Streptacidiphilus sp. ASG 303]|uniref:SpdD protein n=1 Tax=Streptacidiphilus sp. ASG 303 TaxID=2896847 RepID=UPI001E29F8FC|nr:SpdD protein [Streptacidiphilus sp. ASG 303]MCD0482332.1 SpdD protein [Streptacidiphilus sp. ASG 303]